MLLLTVRILIFVSLVLSLYMIVLTLERCRSEKRYGFIYCVFSIFLYTLGYFIEITSGNTDGAVLAIKIMYSGACFMSPFFFLFVADYCEIRIPKKYYRIPILIIPVLFYGVVLTFDRHNLLYLDYYYNNANPILGMVIEPGPLYMVGTFYPLLCIALTCVLLVRGIRKQARGGRLAFVLLLISSLAPLIANFIYVIISFFSDSALAGINFTAFVVVASNFIFYFNVIRNDLFDFTPRAYAVTQDLMRDAFVLLDRNMAYSGSNRKARDLFPALADLNKGSSILLLEGWPGLLVFEDEDGKADDPGADKEIEFTLPHRPGMIYSGWRNRIASESGAVLGWVVLIQDITETVQMINNIRTQRDEIAAMRDNLKEGVFLMDREYRIQASYSKILKEILLNRDLQDWRFPDLLKSSYNSRDIKIITDYFNMVANKSVESKLLEEINPLDEFLYTNIETGEKKTLRCFFIPIEQRNGEMFVMGTVQDVTAETALKKRIAGEEERKQDEMRNLFEVIQVDQKVFEDFVEDADHEYSRVSRMFGKRKVSGRELLLNSFQAVHAIKSNALLVGLSSYAEKLHSLESEIKILCNEDGEPLDGDLANIAAELEEMRKEKEKLSGIIEQIRSFGVSGAAKKDDEVFIEALRLAAEKAADGEGKKVVFAVENFDRDALKKGPRRVMKDILTQLVRNAVYHGIETPEERRSLGKSENGRVTLSLALEGGAVRVILSDDGAGLDFNRIERKAEDLKLLAKDDPRKTDPQFLSGFIFHPGFSTSETEGFYAGRGIGLSLVRDRLREVRGKIQLSSKRGRGLAFDIQIPIDLL